VIVLDQPDAFQVVTQPEHALLSAELAAAWADQGELHDSVVTAARRHDDGWGVWEQSPQVDDSGRPIAVFDVDIRSHLAFYRAGIAAITEEDPYAGLLVSMHGAGIYQQRYGTDLALNMSGASKAQELVDGFIREQEVGFSARAQALRVDGDQCWADYHRLQWFDRLSLAFCLRDWDDPAPEPIDLGEFTITPLGAWGARVSPWPFKTQMALFSLARRRYERRSWTRPEFYNAFKNQQPETVEILLEA